MLTQFTRPRSALLVLMSLLLTACNTSHPPALEPTGEASPGPRMTPTAIVERPTPTAPHTPAFLTSLAVPSPTPSVLAGIEVLNPTGKHPEEAQLVRLLLPEVLEYLTERTGKRLQPPVKVVVSTIRSGDRCAVRGLALPDAGQIYLYVGHGVSDSEIATALSHELAHLLQEQIAGGNVGSVTLAEGFATYAQGRYWPRWDEESGFQAAVRRLRAEDSYIPLTRSILPCDTRTRDRIYTERAAFVEWLIETFGQDKFWRINRLSATRGGSDVQRDDLPYIEPPVLEQNPTYEHAPWTKVYGRDLPELEREWLASL